MIQNFFRRILPRRLIPILMLLIQIALLLHLIFTGSVVSQLVNLALNVFSVIACIYIVSRPGKSAFKISWILLILMVPLFGISAYLLFSFQGATRKFRRRIEKSCQETAGAFYLPPKPQEDPEHPHSGQIRYLENCGFPAYDRTHSTYLPLGEAALDSMLEAMEQAQQYIFLEFFIIEEGKMWSAVLDVLKRKAAQGVQVRLIYDDLGCFFLLSPDYPRRLAAWGIQCAPFNPFRPMLTAMQNNRDHRKILSVDGKVAFTGGINLADEYINAVSKFGHWKDTAVRLEGHGAWSLTAIFLQTWRLCTGTSEDPASLYPWHTAPCPPSAPGLVQPYCDDPLDTERVGEQVYLHIISRARRYLYITTPYLIVDDAMVSALILAARSGVDVRIITPHIWDKRLVHITTRSYYRELIQGGVKIYEYTPGFIHSKTFVCDDSIATVGTINLDFRSLYLHFECGVCLYGTESVAALKADLERLMTQCQPIAPEDCRCNFLMRITQDVMRLFAPLL